MKINLFFSGSNAAAIKAAFFIGSSLAFMILCGCSAVASHVRTGDAAIVDFTCRLQNGRVVYTTREEVAGRKEALSPIFLPGPKYGPAEIIAGLDEPVSNPKVAREFEKEIFTRLSAAVVGLPVGKQSTVILKSEVVDQLSDGERFIKIGRRSNFPNERTVKVERLIRELGHDPHPGDQVFSMPGFKGVVKAVDGNDARISVVATDGYIIAHPYGKAVVHSYADHYELYIETETGHVVRTLGLVGRVTAVDDSTLTLDYGNPFGGEELTCDVVVESILPPAENPNAGRENGKDQKQ